MQEPAHSAGTPAKGPGQGGFHPPPIHPGCEEQLFCLDQEEWQAIGSGRWAKTVPAGGEVDAECGEVDAECGQVDAESGEVDAECGEVDAECGEVDAECGEMDAECGEVDAQCGEMDAEFGEVDAECGEVDAECGAANLGAVIAAVHGGTAGRWAEEEEACKADGECESGLWLSFNTLPCVSVFYLLLIGSFFFLHNDEVAIKKCAFSSYTQNIQ